MADDADPRRAALSGLELFERIRDGELPTSPWGQLADQRIAELGEGRAVLRATPDERHLNYIGFVHGGWVATLMDSALGSAAHTLMPAGERAVTVEIKVNLTRPVAPGTPIAVTAEVQHRGRRTLVVEGRMRDDRDRLLALALGTFAVVEAPAA